MKLIDINTQLACAKKLEKTTEKVLEQLITKVRKEREVGGVSSAAVNWADLHCTEVCWTISEQEPAGRYIITIEEASPYNPEFELAVLNMLKKAWLPEDLPPVLIHCDW